MSSTSARSPLTDPLRSILHSVKVLGTANSSLHGCEKGLSLLGYTCKLVATLISCRQPTSATSSTSSLGALGIGLDDLYRQTDCARYAIRLINGPFSTLDACMSDSWSHAPLPTNGLERNEDGEKEEGVYPYTRESHPVVRVLEKLKPYTMALYYPLEYLAYAGWYMPGLLYDPPPARESSTSQREQCLIGLFRDKSNWRTPAQFSAMSCLAWLCYVVCDLAVQVERCHRISAILLKLQDHSHSTDAHAILDLKDQLRASKIQLVQGMLCLLPAFAWSWPDFGTNPKVPKTIVRLLMWAENIVAYSSAVNSYGWGERQA